ncbi:hypothetical protein IF2G_03917 [Cordyceps javanica]|nr:hypothetical protein IF2G_03917 [Cordyceps javanica]
MGMAGAAPLHLFAIMSSSAHITSRAEGRRSILGTLGITHFFGSVYLIYA